MLDLTIPIAFMAGVVSFFAPCVIPLLPAYLSYITGLSVFELKTESAKRYLIVNSLFYVLGFSLIFVILGTTAAAFSGLLFRNKLLVQRIGGAFIVIFGLDYAGFIHIPYINKISIIKAKSPIAGKRNHNFRSFLVGVTFASSWSACVGPILGSILALAASSSSVYRGAMLLFFYSLGMSIPFLAVSLTFASSIKKVKKLNPYLGTISRASGIILVIIGFLLLTNLFRIAIVGY